MSALQINSNKEFSKGEILIEAPLRSDALFNFHGELIQYCVYGSLKNPVNVVMGGISARAYVANTTLSSGKQIKGWWQDTLGIGKPIDLRTQTVIGLNYLPDDKLAQKFFTNNISISTQDQAHIVNYLLAALEIKRLHAFIGSSYGGMVALAYAELFPNAIDKLIVLCASDQANARTTAFRSIQRSIIKLADDNNKEEAISLARSLGMVVYRSHLEFEQRFSNQPVLSDNKWSFPITDYIYSRGKSIAKHFSAERFVLLSESCDLHQIRPENITTDTLLIGFDSDDIVKLEEIKCLSKRISGKVKNKTVKTIYGHDGFLVEQAKFAKDIRKHLNN